MGNVKSLSRKLRFVHPISKKECFRLSKEQFLSQCIGNTGYLMIGLCNNNKRKPIRVHQLVAEAFLGHKINGYSIIVDHINGNKEDNNVSNLQLITQRENSSRTIRGTSNYTGVSWAGKSRKWMSSIKINSKSVYIGCFDNEIDAHNAYQKALNELN